MFALTLALIALPVSAARAADGETRIIVGRDPGLSGAQKAEIRDDAGVRLQQTLRIPNAEVVTAPAGDASNALRALRSDPNVQWAEVDHVSHVEMDDSYLSQQWAVQSDAIDAADAWAAGALGSGVTVAVVDSGVDVTHPDLVDRLAPRSDWWDFVGDDADPQDANGHGTYVAGIIAATGDNGIGIAGVAPSATIMPVRVMDANGAGTNSDIADGLDWAADHGARIVNVSLGGSYRSTAIETAIEDHPGTLFVVAAGNSGSDNDTTPEYPCDLPEANIVCVGASDRSDAPASFSNYGRRDVDMFAPGVDILSTYPVALSSSLDLAYATGSGTSMAAPQVSGVAALIVGRAAAAWSRDTGADLATALRSSVDPVGALAGLSVTGGRIDAMKALSVTPPAPTVAAVATPTPTPTPAPLPASTPAPVVRTSAGVVDSDHDGRPDSTDACPTEPAATANGCPLPRLRALRVSVAHHRRVSARVRADRVARISVRIARRTCRAHHGCRYHRVAAKTASGRRTTLARRLRSGRYRVSVRLASAAGRGATGRRTVRVR